MKILFLDIDGVLNSKRSAFALGGYPHSFELDDMARFDLVAVALVRRLCKKTDANVVLSSTWRYHFKAGDVAEGLQLPVIDVTPLGSGYMNRGNEVAEWLAAHPEVTHYAIVDDIDAFLPEQQPHFVQTDEMSGLSLANYQRLHQILTETDCAILTV